MSTVWAINSCEGLARAWKGLTRKWPMVYLDRSASQESHPYHWGNICLLPVKLLASGLSNCKPFCMPGYQDEEGSVHNVRSNPKVVHKFLIFVPAFILLDRISPAHEVEHIWSHTSQIHKYCGCFRTVELLLKWYRAILVCQLGLVFGNGWENNLAWRHLESLFLPIVHCMWQVLLII